MRRGELLGLRWSDVDFDAKRLRIASTRVAAAARVVVGSPKTERGRRTVALDDATVAALRQLRTMQMAERLALSVPWDRDGLVISHLMAPASTRRR
jgi:integrase